ncbi:MAG TPA: glycosyltransferase family 39 protein [Planctomycetota bacterium]|nr:glycosyltransferase family 39 protein [Planctomycetota bacterium]
MSPADASPDAESPGPERNAPADAGTAPRLRSGAAPVEERRRGGAAWLAIACSAYLILRGVILWQAFEAVALAPYEVHNMGNLARVLSTGAAGPPLWQHYDNAGGQQLVALLAAPLYALFGDSYLVLKLVPVLLGLGALVLLWRLMDREFGRTAAVVAAALYVIGPPTLLKYSMIASGNHFEHVFFALWLYTAFAALHRGGGRTRRGWLLLNAGLAAGLSLWVYPGAAVTVLLFGALHLLLAGWRRTLADLPAAGAGLLAGLAPLIATNVASGGRTLGYTSDSLGARGGSLLARLGGNLATMLGDMLPRAGAFEDLGPVPARVAEWTFLAAFVAAWILALVALVRGGRRGDGERPGWERWRTAPLLAYLPVFLLVIGVGRWDFDAYGHPLEVGQFRYFVTHFVFAAMLIGVGVGRLAAGHADERAEAGPLAARHAGRRSALSAGRRAAAGLLAAAALLPMLNTLPVAAPWPGTQGAGLRYAGHHFPYYGLILLAYAERDPRTGGLVPDEPAIARWLAGLPRRDALEAWTGVGYDATWSCVERRGAAALADPSLLDLRARLDGRAPDVQIALARGIGSALRGLGRGPPAQREMLRRLLLRVQSDAHPLAPALAEGLCLDLEYALSHDVPDQLDKSFAIAELVPPALLGGYRRGLGIQVGRLAARDIPADLAGVRRVLGLVKPAARADVGFGFGWGFAELASPAGLAGTLADLGQSASLVDALHGAGAGGRHLQGPDANAQDRQERDEADAGNEGRAAPDAALDAAARAALDAGRDWPGYPEPWAAR